MYNTCKIFPHSGEEPLMMATAGPKHVTRFMYFYIKQLTLDGTIVYFKVMYYFTP
jgi:hypothetical protein